MMMMMMMIIMMIKMTMLELSPARKAYGPDQGFLKRYLWPWAKWSAVSHDSYFCRQFARTSPFPSRRKNDTNNFVAAVVEAGDFLTKPCPAVCRPKDHQDWVTC